MASLHKSLALPWPSNESTYTIGGISDGVWMFVKGYHKILSLCGSIYSSLFILHAPSSKSLLYVYKLLKFYWAVCVRTVSSEKPHSLTHSLLCKLCAGMHGESSLFALLKNQWLGLIMIPLVQYLDFWSCRLPETGSGQFVYLIFTVLYLDFYYKLAEFRWEQDTEDHFKSFLQKTSYIGV